MKHLYIIRHGKSDWYTGEMDYDRPLNSRGRSDAPRMGKYLLKHHLSPNYVLSSSAKRAISTATLLVNSMGFNIEKIDQRRALYHASAKEIVQEISSIPNSINTLYVFGHNPGLSDLVSYLSGSPNELKTCCTAILELHVDGWNELSRETCSLSKYISPRDI